MYIIPLAWIWPFWIQACHHVKDVASTSCADGNLFLLFHISCFVYFLCIFIYILSVVRTEGQEQYIIDVKYFDDCTVIHPFSPPLSE